jgi:8-amino-7-oxononanoate synthase
MYSDDFLQKKLNERTSNDALRSLRLPEGKADFCSNDYLGIAHEAKLSIGGKQAGFGSTGSRLLAGNYPLIETVEKEIAAFHHAPEALLFNSGYDANIGLLSSVPQKGDTVIYDYLCHASIRDGIRLSFAQSFSFAHNDLSDLEKKIQRASGTIFIVTESVFSMDGDIGPLTDLVAICKKYHAHLIIDEAHATGVLGERGEGLVQQLALEDEVFARVHTFGKACGCHGAVVLGSGQLRNYLINFARSLIYSTALPEHAVAVIRESYRVFPSMQAERKRLKELVHWFQQTTLAYEKLVSFTPIQAVIVPGNEQVKKLAQHLQDNDLDVRPILYPTVPKGRERLRIVLHAFNTDEEIDRLITCLK